MKHFFLSLLAISCALPKNNKNPEAWGIQLQNYEGQYGLTRIKDAPVRLWVMDYASSADHEFSSLEIELLKDNKKIISYLSIGEIENYRFYYPSLTQKVKGAINPLWKDNQTANYWEREWHDVIVEQYLPKILNAHFDGVFLDIIDAFERFPDKAAKAEEMANLVIEISKKAKSVNKNFVVILQNGIHIRRHLKDPDRLMDAIDGVNVENVFFEGNLTQDNPFKENLEILEDIRFYQQHSKFVLSLEYLQKPELLKNYFSYAKKIKVIPLAAEKKLQGPQTFAQTPTK